MFSPEELRELLTCSPESGKVFWMPRTERWFLNIERRSAEWACKNWNSTFAGKQCFKTENKDGYLFGRIFGKKILTHRVVWCLVNGYWSENEIDHLDQDKKNNCISNLSHKTHAENSKNKGKNIKNKSGFTGVSWHKSVKKWQSQISCNGVIYCLGYFDSPEQAHEAYVLKARELGFTDLHIFGN